MKVDEFALGIGIPESYLKQFSKQIKYCYFSFYRAKKSGGKRTIDAPNRELKGIQSWILHNILNDIPISQCAHGFAKNKGIRTNAMLHKGKRYILCLDIKDFFPTIIKREVYKIFLTKTNDNETSNMLTDFCCYHDKLPQGGVTSPALSNIIFRPVDDDIQKHCEEKRITYSRYADDLTFSSNNRDRLVEIEASLSKILLQYGYRINKKKRRFMSGKKVKLVTGLTLNSGYPSIGRIRKRMLRAALYNSFSKHDPKINMNWIRGMLAFLRDIEPRQYQVFISYINNLRSKD